MIVELRALIKGRVQGVGFRWTVVDYAKEFGLKGSVQNLTDGSVEVIAQAEKVSLDAFLEALQADPGYARIRALTKHYCTPRENYVDFTIIH